MASTNGVQGAPSNLTCTIDGLTSLYSSSGTEITGNYINSVGPTTAVSANVQLAAASSFIISDSAANPLFTSNSTATVLARAQSTFVPVTGPDLVNVTYLNSLVGGYITTFGSTTILNKTLKLSPGTDSFIITDNSNTVLMSVNSSGSVSVFSRAQSAFSPVTGNDLVNLTYFNFQLTTSYISSLNTTQILNKILRLSGGTDTFRITDYNSNVLLQVFDSGTTVMSRPQTGFTPSTGNDLTNKTYVDGVVSGYIPYVNATQNIDINSRNFTSLYNKIDSSLIGCGVVTTSIATVGGTQNIFWRPNFVGPLYGWILSSEATANPGVSLNIKIPYLYSDAITSSGTITASGIISTTSTITASGSISSTSSNVSGFKGLFENNLNTGGPSVGVNGGLGDRLILYRGGTSENPYSLGIDSYTLWLSASGNSSTNESLFNLLFYSGQRARWKMNGDASTANLTSQQTFMNISDQSGNKLVSSANSLRLSTTSNGPILLSVNNGTSNALVISDTFTTCDDLNIRGTFGGVSGTIIRLGNATSLGSGYDCIEWVRPDSNPCIRCGDNFIALYASGVGSFVGGAQIGDMVIRVASGDAIRFTTNAGASSLLTMSGTNITAPSCIFNINAGSSYAISNNFMSTGSLTLGDSSKNYGGGYGWNSNTAGLLLECSTRTEIAVHDGGTRVASFMFYEGDATNQFIIGRDMGWGKTRCNFYDDAIFQGNINVIAARSSFGAGINHSGPVAINCRSEAIWIGGVFGSTNPADGNSSTSNVVVIGTHTNAFGNGGACIGSHNYALNAWASLVIANAVNVSFSDERIKENIITATNSICYDTIKKIRIVRYNLKTDLPQTHGLITKDKNLLGVLAQEFEKIFPKSTTDIPCPLSEEDQEEGKEPEYIKSINTDQLQYTLVGCVQEMQSLLQDNLKENIDNKQVIENQQKQINHLMSTQELLVKQISELTIAMNNITSRLKG